MTCAICGERDAIGPDPDGDPACASCMWVDEPDGRRVYRTEWQRRQREELRRWATTSAACRELETAIRLIELRRAA
jgi:hypothetical protein